MGIGWFVVMNVLQPRLMRSAVGIHPIVVLGSVLIGSKIAGIAGAIFGIPIAAVLSAFFFHCLALTREPSRWPPGRRAGRGEREGRKVRIADASPCRASTPTWTRSPHGPTATALRSRRSPGRGPGGSDDEDRTAEAAPDMTRERARTERRDLDKERGEPVAGGAGAAGRAPSRPTAGPLRDWSTRPKILITNDDGVESRGLLALKQALDPIGDTTVVAPDTNQSAVGHQKTLMRPLRVRERTLGRRLDGATRSTAVADRCRQPRVPRLLRARFDLVASGINYGANLGDDITYSGTVSAAMEAVINSCPAFAIRRSTTSSSTSPWPRCRGDVVARNILEHGL